MKGNINVELTYFFVVAVPLAVYSFIPGIYVSGFLHCDLFIFCQISCRVHFGIYFSHCAEPQNIAIINMVVTIFRFLPMRHDRTRMPRLYDSNSAAESYELNID